MSEFHESSFYEDWMLNWLFSETRDIEGLYTYKIYFCYAPDSIEPVYVSLSLDSACKFLKEYKVNE